MAMSVASAGERILDVEIGDDDFTVSLADGRRLSVPYAWYPRLLHATQDERDKWEIAGAGHGIHWPEIDEDLSSEGLLRGAPAPVDG